MPGGQPVLRFDHELDRRSFLRWAGVVGIGAGLVVGGVTACSGPPAGTAVPLPSTGAVGGNDAGATADPTERDVAILNYTLTLEYLQAELYAQGIKAGVLAGRDLELVTAIGAHEQAHVQSIIAMIGKMAGTAAPKPTITFPAGTFATRASFLGTASTVEELGVAAYHGQMPLISSIYVLRTAAAIAGVQSRHAATVAALAGGKAVPSSFEVPKPMADVLAAVTPFVAQS